MNKLFAVSLGTALVAIVFILVNIYTLLEDGFGAIESCVQNAAHCSSDSSAPK